MVLRGIWVRTQCIETTLAGGGIYVKFVVRDLIKIGFIAK